MIDYNKLSEIVRNNHGNEPVEVVVMMKQTIRIYPNGNIYPGKIQQWIPNNNGVKTFKPKPKPKEEKLNFKKDVGKSNAWQSK